MVFVCKILIKHFHMPGCCSRKKTDRSKKLVNNLKSSIFCGVKGFLTFSLASLSYLEYSFLEKQEENKNQYDKLRKEAAFTVKKNLIPFLEMVTTVPIVCALFSGILKCVLICSALMIATCFLVRILGLREKLLENLTSYSEKEIKEQYSKDSIKFPIFNEERKYTNYNSPNQGQLLDGGKNSMPYLSAFLIFPIKILQSCIMLSLAFVNLLEVLSSLLVDAVYDRTFLATKADMQRSGHLFYASVRNIIPITQFDESVAEFIGKPKATCCGI